MEETMDADRTDLNGKPVDPEAADRAIECFIEPMLDVFRLVRDENTQNRVIRAYALHLARFDEHTLARALEWFEANRKDPFMPTIAECIECCERIYSQTDEAKLETAFGRLYPLGGGPREMWDQNLGEPPGHPACKLSRAIQARKWRERLEWFRNLALGKIGGVPRGFKPPQSAASLGYGLHRLLLNYYDIDTTNRDTCPVPIELLEEFDVPVTSEEVELRIRLECQERAAAVDQANTRH
jgi:hypothetical protein